MAALNIDTAQSVQIPLRAVIGESIAVLGIKGSGKTNTAAVLIEEMLANGLPMTIVDIEGEYWGLKQRFEIFVIGRSANVDVTADVGQAAAFAEFSVKHGVSLILDLSEFEQEPMREFLLRYFQALWVASSEVRRPYQIVLEEAHEFVPQSIRTPLKDMLTRIALRGRKRGLGIVTISQRSAKVEKDILTQAAILFLHRVVHPIDMHVYQDIVPLPPREVETIVAGLHSGDALVLVDNQALTAHIRLRHTFHVGSTPELHGTPNLKLKRVNSALLEELRNIATQQPRGGEGDEQNATQSKLEAEIKNRNAQILEQQQTIERLQTQVDLLSKLTLTVDNGVIFTAPTPGGTSSSDGSQDIELTPAKPQNSTEEARQRKRFDHLIGDVHQLPRFQRATLAFLIERDGSAFSVSELARWLKLSTTTLENRPPLEMIKMGLLARTGTRGNFKYTSSARQQMSIMFPNLSVEQLIESLTHALKQET